MHATMFLYSCLSSQKRYYHLMRKSCCVLTSEIENKRYGSTFKQDIVYNCTGASITLVRFYRKQYDGNIADESIL
jgi:hypothetical protein